MRYLSESFAVSALRRSASIEQFRGPTFHHDRQGVRWVSIEPRRSGRYAIVLNLAWDAGGEDLCDLTEFPPLDPDADEAGHVIAEAGSEVEALEGMERRSGCLHIGEAIYWPSGPALTAA